VQDPPARGSGSNRVVQKGEAGPSPVTTELGPAIVWGLIAAAAATSRATHGA